MKTYDFVIPANSRQALNKEASVCVVTEATAGFLIAIDQGDLFEVERGFKVKTRTLFSRLDFINETGSDITIKVWVGDGDLTDGRLSISGSVETMSQGLNFAASWHYIDVLDGSRRTIADEDLDRRAIGIHNDGGGRIWVAQFPSVTAGFGVPLDAGEKMIFPTGKGIYAWAEMGDAKVSYWEYR